MKTDFPKFVGNIKYYSQTACLILRRKRLGFQIYDCNKNISV